MIRAATSFTSTLVGVVVASAGPGAPDAVGLGLPTGVEARGSSGAFLGAEWLGELAALGEAACLASAPFFGPKKDEMLPTATGGEVLAFFAGGAICHVCHGSFYKVHRVYYRGRWLRAMETRTKWAMASMAM